MIKEFEARSEQEAIDMAIAELNLDRDEFDVEIVESAKKGLIFRKGSVKIRVHVEDDESETVADEETETIEVSYSEEFENDMVAFLSGIIEKMGYPGEVAIQFREARKIGLEITSDHSSILIGKKGKNLDAIQVLLNVYAGKMGQNVKIVVDTENYRARREDALVQMAIKMAHQVKRSKRSKLLEPMNPFERRLIHTALNDMDDIDTKSEGEGLMKQVRIYYRGE